MNERERQLRRRLQSRQILIVPGATDALTARLVEDAGFPVVYATGAGIANTQFGFPDLGLLSMAEVSQHVRRMCDSVGIPVIADADTGYGNVLAVRRTVREFEHAGVAAIQLEDQVDPKRCGHFAGKAVIPLPEMVSKIRIAVATRDDPDLIIIARTDARAIEGIDRAIERAQAYEKAGADVMFVEAPETVEEMRRVPQSVRVPCLINLVEDGRTPLLPVAELEAMGYRIALYANMLMRSSVWAGQQALRALRETGTTSDLRNRMITMTERNRLTQKAVFDRIADDYSRSAVNGDV